MCETTRGAVDYNNLLLTSLFILIPPISPIVQTLFFSFKFEIHNSCEPNMSNKPPGGADKQGSKYLHKFFPDGYVSNLLDELNDGETEGITQHSSKKDDDKFSNPSGFFKTQNTSKKQKTDEWALKFLLSDKGNSSFVDDPNVRSLCSQASTPQSNKTTWGKASISTANQANDPWYQHDVWGEDITDDILQQITLDSSTLTQPKKKKATPKKSETTKNLKVDPFDSISKEEEDNFLDCLEILASQGPSNFDKTTKPETTKNLKVPLNSQSFIIKNESTKKPTPSTSKQTISQTPKSQSIFLPTKMQKLEPFNIPKFSKDCMSVKDKLTLSQRKLEKPTKSLPVISQTHTTEWLRNQLDKVTKECTELKQNVQLKDGEAKLLREKLKSVQSEIEKQKNEKIEEIESVKRDYEGKVKKIAKELDVTKTRMLFKSKEKEAGTFWDLKNLSKIDETEIIDDSTLLNTEEEDELPDQLTYAFYHSDEYHKTISMIKTGEIDEDEAKVFITLSNGHWDDFMSGKMTETFKVNNPCKTWNDIKTMDFGKSRIKRNPPDKGRMLTNALSGIDYSEEPMQELNCFSLPRVDYAPSILTQADLSDKFMENYLFRRPTLVDLWDTNYNEFGPIKLSKYEETEIGKPVEPDISKVVLGKSRFYSTLKPIRTSIFLLQKAPIWGHKEFLLGKEIIELVTEMARELYATLGDVRFRHEEFKLPEREVEVIHNCYNTDELNHIFNPLSTKKLKEECYVELRRGIAHVAQLCLVHPEFTRFVLQPKGFMPKMSGYLPSEHIRRNEPIFDFSAVKKSTTKLNRSDYCLPPTQEFKLNKSASSDDTDEDIEMISDKRSTKRIYYKTVEELKNAEKELNKDPIANKKQLFQLALNKMQAFPDMVNYEKNIESDEEISTITDSPKPEVTEIPTLPYSPANESLHKKYITANWNLVLNEVEERCSEINIEHSEELEEKKTVLKGIYDNMISMTSKMKLIKSEDIPKNLDYSHLFKDDKPTTQENSNEDRKRKWAEKIEEFRSKKHELKVLGECLEASVGQALISGNKNIDVNNLPQSRGKRILQQLPGPSKSPIPMVIEPEKSEEKRLLYLNPYTNEPEHKNRIKSSKNDPTDGIEIDPMITAEIVDIFSKKHTLLEDEEDTIPVPEIQIGPDYPEEEVEEEPDEEFVELGQSELLQRSKLMSTPRCDIEYISDLVEKWSKKMKNAGLLELLCEIFIDAGSMRYTPRLNAIMIATVDMLKEMLKFNSHECEPHLNKMLTIVREIVYTRPSPLVISTVLDFICAAVIEFKKFARMMCHNADPTTFSADEYIKSWLRGACLLEVLCLIVDTTLDDTSNWKPRSSLCQLAFVVFMKNEAGKTWCMQESTGQRRCTCLTALINTSLSIYYDASTTYRALSYSEIYPQAKMDKNMTKDIVFQALSVLEFLVKNDELFSSHISNRMWMFTDFLDIVFAMHNDKNLPDFVLPPRQLQQLSKLMKQNLNSEKPNFDKVPDMKRYMSKNLLSDLLQTKDHEPSDDGHWWN